MAAVARTRRSRCRAAAHRAGPHRPGPWQRAHDWLACAAAEPAVGGPDSHLYYGAPALAFALHAAADRPGRYARALDTLDRYVTKAIRDRLAGAHARMDRGEMPALAEFDAIRGLSGMGGLLLHRDVHTDVLREVLTYLVRLTEPVKHDGEVLPGWWSHLAPSGTISPEYPEGHANNGVAHGIGGPLAVLSLAARRGITVDGHLDAITGILTWLDHWQQDGPAGPWWPYWITREQLRSGTTGPGPPGRPGATAPPDSPASNNSPPWPSRIRRANTPPSSPSCAP